MKPRDFFAILLREGLAIVVEHLGGLGDWQAEASGQSASEGTQEAAA